jgi:hypothetical protein
MMKRVGKAVNHRNDLADKAADTDGEAADNPSESRLPRQTKNTTPPAYADGAISTPGVDQLNG